MIYFFVGARIVVVTPSSSFSVDAQEYVESIYYSFLQRCSHKHLQQATTTEFRLYLICNILMSFLTILSIDDEPPVPDTFEGSLVIILFDVPVLIV